MRSLREHTRGTGPARTGSTLIIVALLMAAVATLSLSFLAVLRSTHQENQSSREGLSALYACEAGLTAGVESLTRGGTGDVGSEQAPVVYGGQSYWVEATAMTKGRTSLVSVGRDDASRMGVEMVVQPLARGLFRWAAFGDEYVHMDSNSRTDSYDSSVGTYLSQQVNGSGSNAYANTDGDIGSNGNISMDSNIGVWGDAHPGPGGTVTCAGGSDPGITGSTTPLTSDSPLPELLVPAIPLGGDYIVNTTTLTSGSYHFGQLQVNMNKTLTITGPATIVCEDFKLKSGSKITVDATNGPVEFFVLNDFILNSNTLIASTDRTPLDVAVNLMSDNILDPGVDVNFDEDLVDFDSGSKMYGSIYAPSASITIDSNFELFGSLLARRVDLNSNCRIHYDEQLQFAIAQNESRYQRLSWRLVSAP
jgi:hypothetical protein